MSTNEQEQAAQAEQRKRPQVLSTTRSDAPTERVARISDGYGTTIEIADADSMHLVALLARHGAGEDVRPVRQRRAAKRDDASKQQRARERIEKRVQELAERRRLSRETTSVGSDDPLGDVWSSDTDT